MFCHGFTTLICISPNVYAGPYGFTTWAPYLPPLPFPQKNFIENFVGAPSKMVRTRWEADLRPQGPTLLPSSPRGRLVP